MSVKLGNSESLFLWSRGWQVTPAALSQHIRSRLSITAWFPRAHRIKKKNPAVHATTDPLTSSSK